MSTTRRQAQIKLILGIKQCHPRHMRVCVQAKKKLCHKFKLKLHRDERELHVCNIKNEKKKFRLDEDEFASSIERREEKEDGKEDREREENFHII